ncbi:MAG: hypothetical protein HQ541_04835, partial [Mariniphaga sp.]|nr:hypothetical protein [Mariniphaga sp.]
MLINNNKRNVFLFGADAVFDWNGPTTKELTKKLIKIGFKASNGKTITYHIAKTLNKLDYELNFETILSVIEELIVYYSYT